MPLRSHLFSFRRGQHFAPGPGYIYILLGTFALAGVLLLSAAAFILSSVILAILVLLKKTGNENLPKHADKIAAAWLIIVFICIIAFGSYFAYNSLFQNGVGQ
jgi:hypothetical protein